jgi:ubiquitin-conjugating enzyme E2 Q
VWLTDFDKDTQIAKDLAMFTEQTGKENVMLEVVFPFNFPALPPFIRVVYPRFHQYTGHITIGGSICVKGNTLTMSYSLY